MATQTPIYDFELPEVGADTDVWGNLLNQNWTAVEAVLINLQEQIDAAAAPGGEVTRIPVGGLYLTTVGTNPGSVLGYGVWENYAEGRALVGVGGNGQASWAGGETRGTETHQLTEAQLPAHLHAIDPPTAQTADFNKTYGFSVMDTDGGLPPLFDFVNFNGANGASAGVLAKTGATSISLAASWDIDHNHNVNIPAFNSDVAGSGQAHNNVQPSIGVYVWRRTA